MERWQDPALVAITCRHPLPTSSDTGHEVPNWSPWLRFCRGEHGIISKAQKREEWEAEAERQRAITAEYRRPEVP